MHVIGVLSALSGSFAAAQEMTVVEPTVAIAGRVVDQRGEPIPAARLSVTGSRDHDRVLGRSASDGDGVFQLLRVARHESFTVTATADGYCARSIRVGDPQRVEVRLQHATTVRAVVRDGDGVAVAGTEVLAQPVGSVLEGVLCRGTTDERGVCALAGVPLAPMRFLAWIPGRGLAVATARIGGADEVTLAPETAGVALRVRPNAAAAAADLVATARPVLRAFDNGAEVRLPAAATWQREDSGVWHLEHLPDLSYRVDLAVPGGHTVPRLVHCEAGRGPHFAEFSCRRGPPPQFVYEGEVGDGTGTPLPGVHFAMRDGHGDERCEAASDAKGIVRFHTSIQPGEEYSAKPTDADWSEAVAGDPGFPVQGRFRTVADPGTRMLFRLVAAARVRGHVQFADGTPAPGATVALRDATSYLGFESRTTLATGLTDGDGAFCLRNPFARSTQCRLWSASGDAVAESDAFTLEPGAREDGMTLRLGPAATIAGVVRDPTGQPVAGLELTLLTTGRYRIPLAVALTDRDGRYRFRRVPAIELGIGFTGGAPFANEQDGVLTPQPGRTLEHDLTLPTR